MPVVAPSEVPVPNFHNATVAPAAAPISPIAAASTIGFLLVT
jgi:hypothetical protein